MTATYNPEDQAGTLYRENLWLRELLERVAQDLEGISARDEYAAHSDALLRRATVPVPLVLISDSQTRVVVHHVGVLGTFDRHVLNLRPGRYTITGSQDGCRDVRKEILLGSDAAPVEVRCEERI